MAKRICVTGASGQAGRVTVAERRDAALACRLALETPAKGSTSYIIAAAGTVLDRPPVAARSS